MMRKQKIKFTNTEDNSRHTSAP